MRIGGRKKHAAPPAAADPGPPEKPSPASADTGAAEIPPAVEGPGAGAPPAQDEEPVQPAGSDASAARKPSRVSGGKWVLLGLLSTLLASGTALMLGRGGVLAPSDWGSPAAGREVLPGGVQEEKLAPFFLPMPEGGPELAFRLDVLVRWDRGTGARFKREAPAIRAKIYEGLKDMPWGGDAALGLGQKDRLEEEIARALRRSLGDKDIQVVLEQARGL